MKIYLELILEYFKAFQGFSRFHSSELIAQYFVPLTLCSFACPNCCQKNVEYLIFLIVRSFELGDYI